MGNSNEGNLAGELLSRNKFYFTFNVLDNFSLELTKFDAKHENWISVMKLHRSIGYR